MKKFYGFAAVMLTAGALIVGSWSCVNPIPPVPALPTPTSTCVYRTLVDDFEDGDDQNQLGGAWSREGFDGGSCSSYYALFPDGSFGLGGSSFGARASGASTSPASCHYPVIRCSFPSGYDAQSKGQIAIAFKLKATTNPGPNPTVIRISITSANDLNTNWIYDLNVPTLGVETDSGVGFALFTREFGSGTLDLAQINSISWTALWGLPFDFTIDDVEFMCVDIRI